ncbi:MAG: 6,7-dimethyl-8-ribityllumazine synthase [Actinobacteria bacterium]|nr:6,7-dimethyl-8-ribityllumazine synthase [Actinomycetota bacterium]
MSGNSPEIKVSDLSGARVRIISARWHREICEQLVIGAKRAITESKIKNVTVHEVPGSFELPLAAKFALQNGADIAVVLGVVLKGETPHFDYVCKGVTDGVMQVSLELGKPIGFGVLMVENIEQAIARSGGPGSKEDKGYDSAIAALELLRLQRHLDGRFVP